jgi:hypothetical protein
VRSLFGLEREGELALPRRNPLEGGFYQDGHVPHMGRLGQLPVPTGRPYYGTILWNSRGFFEMVLLPPHFVLLMPRLF